MDRLPDYKGSINVGSGFKPKGAYPLMEAHDILVGEDDLRLDEKLASMGNGGGSYVLELTETSGTLSDEQYASLVANAPNVVVKAPYDGATGVFHFLAEASEIGIYLFSVGTLSIGDGSTYTNGLLIIHPDKQYGYTVETKHLATVDYVDGKTGFTIANVSIDLFDDDEDGDTSYSGTLEFIRGNLELAMENPASMVLLFGFGEGISIPLTFSRFKITNEGSVAIYEGIFEGEDREQMSIIAEVYYDGTYIAYIGRSSVNATIPLMLISMKNIRYDEPVITEDTITYSTGSSGTHTDFQNLTATHLLFGSGYVIPYIHSSYNIDHIIGDNAEQKNSGEVMFWRKSTIRMEGDDAIIKLNGETDTSSIMELFGGKVRWCRLSV